MNGAEPAPHSKLPRAKRFRPHIAAFAIVVGLAIALNSMFDLGLPLFWPIAVWSMGLAVHYFIAACHNVDERWIQERVDDMRVRSYDFDHIRDIRERIKRRDDTVVHHEERDR